MTTLSRCQSMANSLTLVLSICTTNISFRSSFLRPLKSSCGQQFLLLVLAAYMPLATSFSVTDHGRHIRLESSHSCSSSNVLRSNESDMKTGIQLRSVAFHEPYRNPASSASYDLLVGIRQDALEIRKDALEKRRNRNLSRAPKISRSIEIH